MEDGTERKKTLSRDIALAAAGVALLGLFLFTVGAPDRTPLQQRPVADLPVIAPDKEAAIVEYQGEDDPAALQALLAQGGGDHFVMVMYHAPWCPYCRRLTEQFTAAAPRTNVAYEVLKVDVEKYPLIAGQNQQAQGVPETHAYRYGQKIDGFSGSAPDHTAIVTYIDALPH